MEEMENTSKIPSDKASEQYSLSVNSLKFLWSKLQIWSATQFIFINSYQLKKKKKKTSKMHI